MLIAKVKKKGTAQNKKTGERKRSPLCEGPLFGGDFATAATGPTRSRPPPPPRHLAPNQQHLQLLWPLFFFRLSSRAVPAENNNLICNISSADPVCVRYQVSACHTVARRAGRGSTHTVLKLYAGSHPICPLIANNNLWNLTWNRFQKFAHIHFW